jgi:hypothetical protein
LIMAFRTASGIVIEVACEDVLNVAADVLALKHAGGRLYGADREVASALSMAGVEVRNVLPPEGQALLQNSEGTIKSGSVLFIGTVGLYAFDYAEIREFGRRVLTVLAGEREIRHVALTLHGPGYGLDESEAFRAEVAGLLDAISANEYPRTLERITIVEISSGRAARLANLLAELEPGSVVLRDATEHNLSGDDARATFENAGAGSSEKLRVFVAMPFAAEFDDLFHYGIQGAVNAAGYLCERADLAAFTGDVIDWVKNRIASAQLAVADLSSANPNVYLEVGFAWGKGVPTVLLAKEAQDLKFDVRGQRCLIYKSIHHLEESLTAELKALPIH